MPFKVERIKLKRSGKEVVIIKIIILKVISISINTLGIKNVDIRIDIKWGWK